MEKLPALVGRFMVGIGRGKAREGKGREGKGREGKGREGKGNMHISSRHCLNMAIPLILLLIKKSSRPHP